MSDQYSNLTITGQKDSYVVFQPIGRGMFGAVYMGVTTSTKEHVAIKIITDRSLSLNRKMRELFEREVVNLKALNSRYVVKMHECVQANVNGEMHHFVVMEYLDGVTLEEDLTDKQEFELTGKKVKRAFAQDKAIQVFKQLCSGVSAMHELGIAHRDLKPANIMVVKDTYKIIDLGFSKSVQDEEGIARTQLGTPIYMPPEILAGEEYNAFQVDVYALGVILFEMLYAQYPFPAQGSLKLRNLIQKGVPDAVLESKFVDGDVKTLLKRMLHANYLERITFREIYQHRIFQSGGQVAVAPDVTLRTYTRNSVEVQRYLHLPQYQQTVATHDKMEAPMHNYAQQYQAIENGGGAHAYIGVAGQQGDEAQRKRLQELAQVQAQRQKDLDFAIRLYENEWGILEHMIVTLQKIYALPADLQSHAALVKFVMLKRLVVFYEHMKLNIDRRVNEFAFPHDVNMLYAHPAMINFQNTLNERVLQINPLFARAMQDAQTMGAHLTHHLNKSFTPDFANLYRDVIKSFVEVIVMFAQSDTPNQSRQLSELALNVVDCIDIDESFRKSTFFDMQAYYEVNRYLSDNQKLERVQDTLKRKEDATKRMMWM